MIRNLTASLPMYLLDEGVALDKLKELTHLPNAATVVTLKMRPNWSLDTIKDSGSIPKTFQRARTEES